MKKTILILVTFVLLWAGWYFCYPYFLRWLEGFSFFSTLSDFAAIDLDMPKDIFKYIGMFLLQFYAIPAVGPALHALYPILIVLCVYIIVRRLSDRTENLMWMAFLTLPVLVYCQLDDMKLAKIMTVLACAVLAMLVVCAATYRKKPFRSMPAFMHNRYLALVMIVVSIVDSVSVIVKNDKLQRTIEDAAYLDYLGENGKWDEILKTVSAQDAMKYDFKRSYVLLALSEKGILPDYAFRYGLSSSSDFVYDSPQDPFECKFNSIFYRALGQNNPASYNTYLYTLQTVSGPTFYWIRTLVDINIEHKNYLLAKKYMDILSHSTCHGKWIRERLPELEAIKGMEPEYPSSEDRFFTDFFMKDISNMVIRDQSERKYADLLLCGILAEKDGNDFVQAFSVVAPVLYSDGKVPSLYQEALLLLMTQNPSMSQEYQIDDEVLARYDDFISMVNSGKRTQAKRKYAGTYWAYIY